MFDFFSLVLHSEVPHLKPFPTIAKNSRSMPSCVHVYMCEGYSMMKKMKKRKVISLFKIKKYLFFSHLSFVQRLIATSEAFFYYSKTSKSIPSRVRVCQCAREGYGLMKKTEEQKEHFNFQTWGQFSENYGILGPVDPLGGHCRLQTKVASL